MILFTIHGDDYRIIFLMLSLKLMILIILILIFSLFRIFILNLFILILLIWLLSRLLPFRQLYHPCISCSSIHYYIITIYCIINTILL